MKPIKIIVALVVIAAAAAGGYALALHPEVLPWSAAHEADEGRIRLYGNVDVRDASLAFNGSEHVASVLVEEGDRVEPGTLIATLVSDRLEAQLAEAQARAEAQRAAVRRLKNGSRPEEIERAHADLQAAVARLENAQRDAQRLRQTSATGATSERELDAARAKVDVEAAEVASLQQTLALAVKGPRDEDIAEAEAQLAETEAAIALLRTQLDDTRLVAPAAGVVQSRVLEPGEFATPDRPVVSIALTGRKWVRAYLPEPLMGRVAMGMRAEVRSDTYGSERFEGWVGFISPTAEFTPKTVQTTELRTQLVYEVRVYVDDPSDRLRLGQPVSVVVDPDAPRRAADDEPGNKPRNDRGEAEPG